MVADIPSVLIQIWNKLTQPLPQICLGIAILLFVPDDFKWIGWLSIFVGIGFLIQLFIGYKYKEHLQQTFINQKLLQASNAERRILAPLIDCDIDTLHRSDIKDEDFNVCISLRDKGVFMPNQTSFTLSPYAYKKLNV